MSYHCLSSICSHLPCLTPQSHLDMTHEHTHTDTHTHTTCSHSLEQCVHCVVHTSPAAYTSGKAVLISSSTTTPPSSAIWTWRKHHILTRLIIKHTLFSVTWQCSSVVLGITPVADTTRSQVYTCPLVSSTWSGEEDVAWKEVLDEDVGVVCGLEAVGIVWEDDVCVVSDESMAPADSWSENIRATSHWYSTWTCL